MSDRVGYCLVYALLGGMLFLFVWYELLKPHVPPSPQEVQKQIQKEIDARETQRRQSEKFHEETQRREKERLRQELMRNSNQY